MKAPSLNVAMAYINNKYYKVEDYPLDPWKDIIIETDPDTILKKSVAYRYKSDLTRGLFPYHGEIVDDLDRNTCPVGIYYKHKSHGRFKIVIIRPRTPAERRVHGLNQELSLAAAIMNGEYSADDFVDSKLNAGDMGRDAYLPPIRTGDDFLSKIVKLAIRLKAAPIEPYGKRMAALAVDQRRSIEVNNIKNNAIRRHRDNSTMSPSKAMQDSDAWQLEMVVGIRNAPGAMHKIQGIPDNGVLLLYPNGAPFDLKKAELINAEDLLTEAIAETSEGIKSGAPLYEKESTTESEE